MDIINIFVRKNRRSIVLGAVLILLSGIINIAVIKFISDSFAAEGLNIYNAPYMFIAILASAWLLGVLAEWVLEGVGHQLVLHLRKYLLRQIVQSDPERFQVIDKSHLLNAFSKDIPQLLQAISFYPYMLYGIALIVFGFIYMFMLSWQIALVVVTLLMLSMFFSNKLIAYCETLFVRERLLHNNLVQSYNNVTDSHSELMLNEHRGQRAYENIVEDAVNSKDILFKAGRLIAVSSQFMGILPLMLIGVVWWLNSQWVEGAETLVISFGLTLMFIRQPIGNLVHQIETILLGNIAVKNLMQLNLAPPKKQVAAEPLKADWQSIKLNRVTYQYPGEQCFSFGQCNLTINRGETVFLVGSNGAGKTTLIKLLCGLYTPLAGEVSVDDEIIRAKNRRNYRAMFSAVLAENYLFDHFLEHDISATTRAYVEDIALKFGLSHIDVSSGKPFDTEALSTGQKKRLAMIVSLMENRSIMILDEWAADQDPVFRKYFYQEVVPQLKAQGITLVVISHDDRYFHVADRVVVVDGGKICEN